MVRNLLTQRLPTMALCLFALGAPWLWATSVAAQCGSGYYINWSELLGKPEVAVVFSGTVIDRQIGSVVQVVTFDVDRVWKGDVTKRTIIYRPAHPEAETVGRSGGGRGFDIGQRYVVVAHRLTETERRKFALKSTSTKSLAVGYCGDGSVPFYIYEMYERESSMGPGTEPRELAEGGKVLKVN